MVNSLVDPEEMLEKTCGFSDDLFGNGSVPDDPDRGMKGTYLQQLTINGRMLFDVSLIVVEL